ncbi:hypothetical protein [Amycolatopsis benzoatilytica]|uniref:hypothetical protein n=1 Tax=Amycolatopsis benzoatilytica TaxID=346045 RepID=UPI00037889D7|nr:hypothetical protein [Amycolatopsis benzoatilytica]
MTTQLQSSRLAAADALLRALSGQNFARIASTMDTEAQLSALLPHGLREFRGPDEIEAAFTRWFGDLDEFELVEGEIDKVGPRLHLRWRARVRGERLGAGWFSVEQQAYADDDGADGRFSRMVLLCSGYCPEGGAR